MKTKTTLLVLLLGACAFESYAQTTFDSSGDKLLNGAYYFRQVVYFVADESGDLGETVSLQGTITFNGSGKYTVTNGTILDTSASTYPTAQPINNAAGTYVLSASGEGYISAIDPSFSGDQIIGLVSHATSSSTGIFIGSSTETTYGYNDLFIATPAGSTAATNASLNGTYTVAYFDPTFPGDATFKISPNGVGAIGNITTTSYSGSSATPSSGSLSGLTYGFNNGVGQIAFPGTANSTTLVGGTQSLYVSPDGSFIFGGNPAGFNMFVGVRSATANPTTYSGLYYQAGVDLNESTSNQGYTLLDSYFGSLQSASAQACGTPAVCFIGHQRVNSVLEYAGSSDFTYWDGYTLNGDGTSADTIFGQNYISSSDGSVRIGYGVGPYLSLNIAFAAPSFAGTGVYLSPAGVVNAASSAPFTAFVSPGEFLTLYGSGLASGTNSASVPFPTTVGNVQVLINQSPAPIYYVSPTQISVIVPYGVTGSVAQIQVVNGGTSSNTVTQFIGQSSVGVFTNNPVGGIGYAAAERANYSVVSESNPAQIGDTIALYLAGMGAVSNQPADGAAAPSNPLAQTDLQPQIYLYDSVGNVGTPTVTYSGLAPGFAGLYQINFVVPTGLAAGDGVIEVYSNADSDTVEALFPIAAASTTSSARAGSSKLRPRIQHHRLPVNLLHFNGKSLR